MKKLIIPIIAVLVGTSFVTYSFLDTFIIPKNMKVVTYNNDFFASTSSSVNPISSSVNNDKSSNPVTPSVDTSSNVQTPTSSEEPVKPNVEYYEDLTAEEIDALFTPEVVFREKEHYSDPNIYIDITTHRDPEDTTTYYVADVRIKSLEYFRTAFAFRGDKEVFGENVEQRPSDICKKKKGILTINGDYYGAQEAGYVLRNGTIFRNTVSYSNVGENPRKNPEDLAIYRDGTFEIFNENDHTLEEIAAKGAWQVFSFGPGLIVDGEVVVGKKDEVATALSGGRNQRTIIGMVAPLHYIFFVNDARMRTEEGFSLYEAANIMKDLHCYCAYNLDGGGSSTMYLDDGTGNANGYGHLVNKPTQDFTNNSGRIGQREVSDIVFIGKNF